MKCPVDATELVISERQGVEIDYCPHCRGIWLDRGEVDKLIERSQDYAPRVDARPDIHRQAAQYDRDNGYRRDETYRRRDDDTPAGGIGGLLGGLGGSRDRDRDRNDNRTGRRERGGWLGELFD